jgi:hypothetical protein
MPPVASFANYPQPAEGPETKYVAKEENNPVFRGIPLAIGAALCVDLSYIEKTLLLTCHTVKNI